MVSRLVLGSAFVGQRFVEEVAGWSGELRVVTDQEDRVETIRNENVPATVDDPTDPAVLAEYAPVDVVLVAQDDLDRATAAAKAAREAFPDATVLAYAGVEASEAERSALDPYVDRQIDARSVLGQGVADLVASRAGVQARRLRRTLRAVEGTLAVVMHDNPDPDAIASAVAMVKIAEAVGTDAVPCYYGEINHQENRAMVNLLDLNLRRLDPEDDLADYAGFALVDHSRPGVNDQLPPDLDVDVVIDHHPPRAPVEATFVDLRSEVGATSTLLTDYLRRFGVEECGGREVATALLYGIRIDTKDFSREVSRADFEAAASLMPNADVGLLDRVESPDVSADTFSTLARAIRHREVEGSVLATCVGEVNDRDALAQAADHLLDMEGIATTLVYGYDDEMVYASARSRGTTLDLGETLRMAFDDMGSAGGHADMAGAQVPLANVLARADDGSRWLAEGEQLDEATIAADAPGFGGERVDGDGERAADDDAGTTATVPPAEAERLEDVVERVVASTFFDAVREHPREVPDDVDLPTTETIDTGYIPSDWDLDVDEE